MDPATREAFADLKADLREALANGFAGVNGRVDDTTRRINDLVSRGEFIAVVQRVDEQHSVLRRDFDQHEQQGAVKEETLRNSDERLRKDFLAELAAMKRETALATRWAISSVIAAVGVGVAVVSWVAQLTGSA